MYGLEVYRRIWFPLVIPITQQLILPGNDLLWSYAAEFEIAKVRQQFGADYVLFGGPCVFFQPHLQVISVKLDEALELHVQIRALFCQLVMLPGLCLAFRFEATLLRLLTLAFPVGVAVDYAPSASVLLFVYSHQRPSLSPLYSFSSKYRLLTRPATVM